MARGDSLEIISREFAGHHAITPFPRKHQQRVLLCHTGQLYNLPFKVLRFAIAVIWMKQISCTAGASMVSWYTWSAYVLAATVVNRALGIYLLIGEKETGMLAVASRFKLHANFGSFASDVAWGSATATSPIIVHGAIERGAVDMEAVVGAVRLVLEVETCEAENDAVSRRSNNLVGAPLVSWIILRVTRASDGSFHIREYTTTGFFCVDGGEPRALVSKVCFKFEYKVVLIRSVGIGRRCTAERPVIRYQVIGVSGECLDVIAKAVCTSFEA